jgi:hypothetical protein
VSPQSSLGAAMRHDHRRILATAMGRSRAKMKYRPVIFELTPERFTLSALQRSVEAICGRQLRKQNFRRLVEASAIVEASGETTTKTRRTTRGALWLAPQCVAGAPGAGTAGRQQRLRREIMAAELRRLAPCFTSSAEPLLERGRAMFARPAF